MKLQRLGLLFGTTVLIATVIVAVGQCFPRASQPAYRFLSNWGREGGGPGEFREPIGIAISANEVFVTTGLGGFCGTLARKVTGPAS